MFIRNSNSDPAVASENFTNSQPYLGNGAIHEASLVLFINRIMGFRFIPKLVTLNDLELRNGPHFALFRRIR